MTMPMTPPPAAPNAFWQAMNDIQSRGGILPWLGNLRRERQAGGAPANARPGMPPASPASSEQAVAMPAFGDVDAHQRQTEIPPPLRPEPGEWDLGGAAPAGVMPPAAPEAGPLELGGVGAAMSRDMPLPADPSRLRQVAGMAEAPAPKPPAAPGGGYRTAPVPQAPQAEGLRELVLKKIMDSFNKGADASKLPPEPAWTPTRAVRPVADKAWDINDFLMDFGAGLANAPSKRGLKAASQAMAHANQQKAARDVRADKTARENFMDQLAVSKMEREDFRAGQTAKRDWARLSIDERKQVNDMLMKAVELDQRAEDKALDRDQKADAARERNETMAMIARITGQSREDVARIMDESRRYAADTAAAAKRDTATGVETAEDKILQTLAGKMIEAQAAAGKEVTPETVLGWIGQMAPRIAPRGSAARQAIDAAPMLPTTQEGKFDLSSAKPGIYRTPRGVVQWDGKNVTPIGEQAPIQPPAPAAPETPSRWSQGTFPQPMAAPSLYSRF